MRSSVYLPMEKDIGTHIVYSDGRIFKKSNQKFIGHSHNSEGYVLSCINGKQFKLHRIIATCFLPKEPGKDIVNHKDGNKENNSVDNLEWCDSAHNVRHAFKMGLMVRHKGSKNSQSKLTEDAVVSIKRELSKGRTLTSISKEHNVSLSCIFLIKKGKSWKHVS